MIEQFGDLLEVFKARSRTTKRNDNDDNSSSFNDDFFNESGGFGEKTTCDYLFVMDDVSGLADESKKFASFVTIARKFNYTCVYIFHVISSEKSIWRTILSQTNIFNVFPASVSLAHVRRILESICIRKTIRYIPQSALWISRPFTDLANRNNRVCLTLDCSGINKDGPGRFRTKADKPDFQTCYFNFANDEQSYNEFVSQRINRSETDGRIQFKIIHLKSKTISEENFYTTEELCNLNKSNGAGTSGDKKKRARAIFGTSYRDAKSSEQFGSGTKSRAGAKPKFLLGQ